MSEKADIRWVQRLSHFEKALKSLLNDIELSTDRDLSDIERRGLIQAFEYTYELAWNSIKDFYQSLGNEDIQGSKDAFRIAFKNGLVSTDNLMKTVKSRPLTSHSYNEETASEIYDDVRNLFYDAFKELADSLNAQKEKRGL